MSSVGQKQVCSFELVKKDELVRFWTHWHKVHGTCKKDRDAWWKFLAEKQKKGWEM